MYIHTTATCFSNSGASNTNKTLSWRHINKLRDLYTQMVEVKTNATPSQLGWMDGRDKNACLVWCPIRHWKFFLRLITPYCTQLRFQAPPDTGCSSVHTSNRTAPAQWEVILPLPPAAESYQKLLYCVTNKSLLSNAITNPWPTLTSCQGNEQFGNKSDTQQKRLKNLQQWSHCYFPWERFFFFYSQFSTLN